MSDFSLKNLKRYAKGLIRAVNYHMSGRLFTPSPTYVCFRVTRNCNSKCIMCSDWKFKQRGEITVEEVRRVFSNPLLKNLKWVNVLGGEPTIRHDISDIIQAIYEDTNLSGIGLNTNGFATDMVLKRITQILEISKSNPETQKKRLNVVISVDGVGDIHNKIRGISRGFERICDTLKQLQILKSNDSRLSVGLSCCVQPQNLHGLLDLENFAREKNVTISFFPMRFAHVFGNLFDRDKFHFQFSPSQVTDFKYFISKRDAYKSNKFFQWA